MAFSERKKIILKAVVDNYIRDAEPVASKSLAQKLNLKLSPATLRNEMAELESLGYLDQPHTSAGRIPSQLGYRLYVDELMNQHRLTLSEMAEINHAFSIRIREFDRMLSEAGKLISSLTSYISYATLPRSAGLRLKHIDLIAIDPDSCVLLVVFSANLVNNTLLKRPPELDTEELPMLVKVLNRKLAELCVSAIPRGIEVEIASESGVSPVFILTILSCIREAAEQLEGRNTYVSGAEKLLSQPEYQDIPKARQLLEYMSDIKSVDDLPAPEGDDRLKITIGSENLISELKNSSVVVASYDLGEGMRGLIGVVGPTRMDYPKVAAKLEYFADRLNNILQLDKETNNNGGNDGEE